MRKLLILTALLALLSVSTVFAQEQSVSEDLQELIRALRPWVNVDSLSSIRHGLHNRFNSAETDSLIKIVRSYRIHFSPEKIDSLKAEIQRYAHLWGKERIRGNQFRSRDRDRDCDFCSPHIARRLDSHWGDGPRQRLDRPRDDESRSPRGRSPQAPNQTDLTRGPSNRSGLAHLNLTPAQQTKIEALRTRLTHDMTNKRAELEKLNIDKEAALKLNNFKQARNLTKKIKNTEADIENLRIKLHEDIFKELTPEQRERYRTR